MSTLDTRVRAQMERNLRVLPWWWVLRWTWLGEGIWVIYLVEQRGVTVGQVLLFEAVLATIVIVSQVPTGVIADRYGRRPTLPTGNARFHRVALRIVGNGFGQFSNEFRSFRTRPNQAHFTAQHIEYLWKFVQAVLAQEITDASDSFVILLRPHRLTVGFGIFDHAAEFQHAKHLTSKSNALLMIKH